MDREVSQHMIEETHARGYFVLSGPIQIKLDGDLGFVGST
jgi:hypothetical protein